MRPTRHAGFLVVLPTLCLLAGCEPEHRDAAEDALDEVAVATRAQVLTGRVIELASAVPPGVSTADAASAVEDTVLETLPCAGVSREGGTLELNFGPPERPCTLSGRALHGVASVNVVSTSSERIEVHHEWTGLGDREIAVDGSADVTWAAGSPERRVEDQVVWKDADAGDESLGGGDRTQHALDGGAVLALDGRTTWTNERGAWDLTAAGVEAGWSEPVPRSGEHTLLDPGEDTWSLLWEQVDAGSYRVEVDGPGAAFDFVVSAATAGPG
ncbi:MAG: hypothetical protein ACQEXJ_09205 [Myxococcota bacterium]